MALLDYVVLAGYFVLMAAIGVICMLRVKVQEDYFLGGRGFGKLLQTFAAFGAGTGSSDPVNTGRTTFVGGLSGMWSVMYWLFVTPFYWITAIWYRRMRHTTLGDWFTERYESRLMGAAYAMFGMFFIAAYGSMMFSAVGKVAAPLVGADAASGAADGTPIEYVLVPIIGVIVFLYGAAGGLRAAYWTDVIQGLCILLLSILLIPFGLQALVDKFGDPNTMGMMDGFRIMHEQAPPEFFSIVGATNKSEFPLHFIVVVVLINLMTVVIQPHFILTGGGSAKDEQSARVGLVVGNFLKRFCTIGWVFTALMALALFADSPELARDPDRTWGVASRELLGPGQRGLMLACLLAALMSSIDVYMIVGSALIVRNLYVPYLKPDATEEQCLRVARWTGVVIVGGSVVMSLAMMNVFQQLKLTWIVLVPVAAPFWIGMYWRRATTAAAWLTIFVCLLVFFIIPWLAPVVVPGLRNHAALTQVTPVIETTVSRAAAPTDVARRAAEIRVWDARQQQGDSADDAGPRPAPLEVGETIRETKVGGGYAIYWTGGVVPVDAQGQPRPDVQPLPRNGAVVGVDSDDAAEPADVPSPGGSPSSDQEPTRVVKQYGPDVQLRGVGKLRCDFLLYRLLGLNLQTYSDSTLRTLDYPPKIAVPFLVMVVVSWLTRANSPETLNRFYVKMKTPVTGDPDRDAAELARSYEQPNRFDDQKLFPGSQLEFQKPTSVDVIGFAVSLAACFGIIALAAAIAQIGA